MKFSLRLYWKNGGWMTLVIASTIVILCCIGFSTVVPVFRQERIRNVQAEVIQLSEKFVNTFTSVRPNVWSSILKNKEMLSHPDAAPQVCSEIMENDNHIHGVGIAYMKEFPNKKNASQPLIFMGRDSTLTFFDIKYEDKYNYKYLLSYFSNRPFDIGYLGHSWTLPSTDEICLPFTIPLSFDSQTIDAFITTVIESDSLQHQLEAFNPYPGANSFVIHFRDSLFTMAPNDTLFNKPAFPWLKEHYGEKVVSELLSLPEDGVVTFSDGNLTFFAGSIYYGQRIFLYTVPTSALTEDLVHIAVNIIIFCIIGFLLISVVCIYTTRKDSHIAMNRELALREMETTATIQMGMLSKMPEGLTSVGLDATLVPAKTVGGDLYYCFRRENLLYFCVGDVSGKGMPAAMFMAKTVSLFKFIAGNSEAPEEIAEKLNGELIQDNETNMFVTIFIGILDMATNNLRYCNAGHNRPVFWNGKDTSEPGFLKTSTNILLGVFSGMTFTKGEIKLPSSSVLMLYTDGVTEAMNENNEQYGNSRLLSLFKAVETSSPESINSSLLNDVRAFSGKREQSDDITIFTLKIR